jgi:hypothetical protein
LMNLRDTGLGGMSALGQKQTWKLVRVMSALCRTRNANLGGWLVTGWVFAG